METVTIQCGACGQVIAVSKEHLGQQVQCPLCGAVIEAPSPEPIPLPKLPVMVNDEDSIFAPPEEEEDIFGRREKGPEIQMPSETGMIADAIKVSPPRRDEATENLSPTFPRPYTPSSLEVTQGLDSNAQEAATITDRDPASELASFTPRRRASRGSLGAIVMIFLVPYSVVITIALGFMIYQRSQFGLDRLPDPDTNGAPVRIRHNWPLPTKQKTELNKEIQIGDVRITPLKVERTAENDLILHMKMENVSEDISFNPFPDSYHRLAEKKNKPYTFIESDPPIYGGYTARFKNPAGKRDDNDNGEFSGVIRPSEAVYAELITYDKEDVRASISRLIASGQPILWRVHVRRGLVTSNGRSVSASAVIGVEFLPSAIEKTS